MHGRNGCLSVTLKNNTWTLPRVPWGTCVSAPQGARAIDLFCRCCSPGTRKRSAAIWPKYSIRLRNSFLLNLLRQRVCLYVCMCVQAFGWSLHLADSMNYRRAVFIPTDNTENLFILALLMFPTCYVLACHPHVIFFYAVAAIGKCNSPLVANRLLWNYRSWTWRDWRSIVNSCE